MTLLIVFVAMAIGISFVCSIAEAVLLSITPAYVALLQEKRKRSGEMLFQLKENVDRPLTAILTLNTIANTVGAAGVGVQATQLFGDEYLGVASGVLTLMILIFSEIIPKTTPSGGRGPRAGTGGPRAQGRSPTSRIQGKGP